MLRLAFLITKKDMRLMLGGGSGFARALLMGLLLLFVFSLSKETGQKIVPQMASAIFWLCSVFCQTLVFNQLYALEETNAARHGLVLAPAPVQGIWLGKSMGGLLLLFMAQLVFLPAAVIFLDQSISGSYGYGLLMLCVADAGICVLGSLLGALSQGQNGRESLLTILLFPMLIPVLLAGISMGALSFGAQSSASPETWLGIACAFDAIFLGAGLLLSGYIYQGDD